jgi:hypothetical protein
MSFDLKIFYVENNEVKKWCSKDFANNGDTGANTSNS